MITSKDNAKIKQLRKLAERHGREKEGLFAAEGEDLVDAALAAGWEPVTLLCADEVPDRYARVAGAEAVESAVLASASALGSGSRVVAVFEPRWAEPNEQAALTLFLDGIADPGNVGTALRSALAFSDGTVVLGPGCADPFSPKAVRASMGTLFQRPPAQVESVAALSGQKLALDGDATTELAEVALSAPVVLCVGAEREGISAQTAAAADATARIAMRSDGPESLNAAMASTIGLYECSRKLGTLQSALHGAAEPGAAHGINVSGQN